VQDLAEALMGAAADALCGAPYGERSPERVNRRTASGSGTGTRGRARSSSPSRSCARARTSPARSLRTRSSFAAERAGRRCGRSLAITVSRTRHSAATSPVRRLQRSSGSRGGWCGLSGGRRALSGRPAASGSGRCAGGRERRPRTTDPTDRRLGHAGRLRHRPRRSRRQDSRPPTHILRTNDSGH
jgi:hypothetical protein